MFWWVRDPLQRWGWEFQHRFLLTSTATQYWEYPPQPGRDRRNTAAWRESSVVMLNVWISLFVVEFVIFPARWKYLKSKFLAIILIIKIFHFGILIDKYSKFGEFHGNVYVYVYHRLSIVYLIHAESSPIWRKYIRAPSNLYEPSLYALYRRILYNWPDF